MAVFDHSRDSLLVLVKEGRRLVAVDRNGGTDEVLGGRFKGVDVSYALKEYRNPDGRKCESNSSTYTEHVKMNGSAERSTMNPTLLLNKKGCPLPNIVADSV